MVLSIIITVCLLVIGRCSPMTNELSFCSSMVWKNVTFPNLRGQSQKEAATEIEDAQFDELVKTNCSIHIRHLICSYYAPVCPNGNHVRLDPCKKWCDQVAPPCKQLLEDGNFPIPNFLNCINFPEEQPCFFIPPGQS